MKNGFHSHYCPRCQKDKECAKVTHCRKPDPSLCADCAYEDYVANEQKETTKNRTEA